MNSVLNIGCPLMYMFVTGAHRIGSCCILKYWGYKIVIPLAWPLLGYRNGMLISAWLAEILIQSPPVCEK